MRQTWVLTFVWMALSLFLFSTAFAQSDNRIVVRIKSNEDIKQMKKDLIEFVWKGHGFPSGFPDGVEKGIVDSNFSDLNDVERIDKIVIKMEFGVDSKAYWFHSKKSKGKLLIYHQGHLGGFVRGKVLLQHFLSEGFDVLAFTMPVLGKNNQPVIESQSLGIYKMVHHNYFKLLETDSFCPLKYFIEPIVVALNYCEKEKTYSSRAMLGFSGGGWTTEVVCALDERINQCVSVAGSLPIVLRQTLDEWSDYEHTHANFYRIANFTEIYILASMGNNRSFLQIFNKYDSCCFGGERHIFYETKVEETLKRLKKGSFEVFNDDSHKEHKISEVALTKIDQFIK